MHPDATPIEEFLASKYSHRRIQVIVENWRVESEIIIDILIEQFRDMGIFFVRSNQERLILDNMIYQIKNLPEITNLVRRAEQEETTRKKSRHAD